MRDAGDCRAVSVSGVRFFVLMLFACNVIAAEVPVSQPVFIPSPRFTLARPFVAASDSGFLTAWDEVSTGHDGRRHVVSPDGDVISSTTWSTNDVIVYDVITGGAGPIILYARSVEDDQLGDSFRLFLLLPKRRAGR